MFNSELLQLCGYELISCIYAHLKMVVETFSRGYVILIVVSSAVAVPLTCYWMNKWLEGYAYRIHISATLIVIVIALIAVTVLLTALVQVLKAVKENSIDVIKNG